jgi:2Fe-2S ferredoxin
MPIVHFDLADGSRVTAEGDVDTPVMFLAKKNNIDAILAECGGACCCATCHVHLSPDWVTKVPEMKEDEQDMLEFAEDVDEFSRLSCQLKLTEAMDGLVVKVPESQY